MTTSIAVAFHKKMTERIVRKWNGYLFSTGRKRERHTHTVQRERKTYVHRAMLDLREDDLTVDRMVDQTVPRTLYQCLFGVQIDRQRVRTGLLANTLILTAIIAIVCYMNDGTTDYFHIGWNDSLKFITCSINTSGRYFVLMLTLALMKVIETYTYEYVNPRLANPIYVYPERPELIFGRYEFQFYANLNWLIQGVKRKLMLFIAISQIDVALVTVLVSQVTSIYTIQQIIKNKQFPENEVDTNNKDEHLIESTDEKQTTEVESLKKEVESLKKEVERMVRMMSELRQKD